MFIMGVIYYLNYFNWSCYTVVLQDVLENEQIKLDNMFKFSLIQDIVRVSEVQVWQSGSQYINQL